MAGDEGADVVVAAGGGRGWGRRRGQRRLGRRRSVPGSRRHGRRGRGRWRARSPDPGRRRTGHRRRGAGAVGAEVTRPPWTAHWWICLGEREKYFKMAAAAWPDTDAARELASVVRRGAGATRSSSDADAAQSTGEENYQDVARSTGAATAGVGGKGRERRGPARQWAGVAWPARPLGKMTERACDRRRSWLEMEEGSDL